MLKKIVGTFVLVAASQLSFAGKVVVFDPQEAILGTEMAQKRIQELRKKPEYAQMVAQAESLRADLEVLSKEATTKGITWSEAERAEHRKKIEYVQADFKLVGQKIQSENSAVMGAIVNEMSPKAEEALKAMVESEDIDMVLRKQVTFYVKPDSDITGSIVEALNKAAK